MKLPLIRPLLFPVPHLEPFMAAQARKVAIERPSIWRHEQSTEVDQIQLSPLARIGGVEGFSGSKVFVADFVGHRSDLDEEIRSYPLLVKVAYGKNHVEKLIAEEERYQQVREKLDRRHHARILTCGADLTPNDEKCVLWSEFVSATGVPDLRTLDTVPKTLRDRLSEQNWALASDSLNVLYGEVLRELHLGEVIDDYNYFDAYRLYRRNGWLTRLQSGIGSHQRIKILGEQIRNPLAVYQKLESYSSSIVGKAHVSGIHGDLHPNNVLVTRSQPVVLIDFGWSNGCFHTIADFVVMEASLKFFSLDWHVARSDLWDFEDAFSQDFITKQPINDVNLAQLRNLINRIRQRALPYIVDGDYERQYLLPLFLVTMGLFKYAASVNNLSHLVLSACLLAETIENTFDL